MLTGVMYVLVPMPYLFFGAGSTDAYGSSLASGWVWRGGVALGGGQVLQTCHVCRELRY
jgi:hypothetical protein